MKRFYIALMMVVACCSVAGAQEIWDLVKIITEGKSGQFYTIKNDLVGVYCPPNFPRVVFAKDDNGYSNKSRPTEEQYNADPKQLYDEADGYFDEFEEWVGSFDQSNWVKIALPEGVDGHQYVGKIIKKRTVTGRVNIQEVPCRPLGLTISLITNPETGAEPTLPQISGEQDYTPNLYCCGNFVKQDSWYLVKPQNQEYANIRWAVWHAADTMFYAPKNQSGLPGSFHIDMMLWEPQPFADPMTIFLDGYQYEYPAIVEFRLGTTLNINIDPGFSGENNIHFLPSPPLRMPVTDNPGVAPTYTDPDSVVYPYTVIVYPLRLEEEPILTGIEETVNQSKVITGRRYYDLQGHMSNTPHAGLNLEQITYSDGTTTCLKMMKAAN